MPPLRCIYDPYIHYVCSYIQRAVSEINKQAQSEEPDGQHQPENFWQGIRRMAIYGLGSLETNRAARFQLALAMVLSVSCLIGLKTAVEVYDPIFSEVDKEVLRAYGCKVPHCYREQIHVLCIIRPTGYIRTFVIAEACSLHAAGRLDTWQDTLAT